ncbi:MAG TPA: alpha-L-fucosidase [Acidobacteriota bacterium]|jgi:alpha-L-fucosidase
MLNHLSRNISRRDALRLFVIGGGLAAGAVPAAGYAKKNQAAPGGSAAAAPAQNLPWYGQELIRGHFNWIHPVWTRPERDFDPRKWLDQSERAGFKSFVFYSKFHDGICNWPSKFQPLKPVRDFVGDITAEAHRRGIRVILYYSGFLDDYAADSHPEWRCVRRDGRAGPRATRGYENWFKYARVCPNSPYRDYALGQIEELLTKYDVDGFWIDAMFFPNIDPTDPEPRHLGCFCKYCREKYTLRTGASLFDIDGTLAQRKWEADCASEFFVAAKAIVRKQGGEKCITYNACGHPGSPYWPEVQQLGDYLSNEGFQFAQIEIGRTSKLGRSSGKPYETITEASGTTHSWTPRNTDLLLLEAATITAYGGTYLVALSPTASGRIFDFQVDQVASVSSYLRKRQDWLTGTKPLYDAAIFHPSYLGSGSSERDAPPLTRLSRGWADLLGQRNIPYAYLYPDADLSPFPLVILDTSFPVTEESVDRVKAYVGKGGSILVELNSEHLQSQAGIRLLSEVLGVRLRGRTEYEAVYLGRLDSSVAAGMTEMPPLVEGPSYRVETTTAQVLANYLYPIAPWSLDRMVFAFHNPPSAAASSDPAITLNKYGDGFAMFVACSLGNTEIRRHQNVISDPPTGFPNVLPQVHEWSLQLGENLALRLIKEPVLRSKAPAGVEIVVNEQPRRHIVHLLNQYLTPMIFADNRSGRMVLADISLAINEKRIGSVRRVVSFDGATIPVQREGGWIHVTVPRLAVHEMLAFEKS